MNPPQVYMCLKDRKKERQKKEKTLTQYKS